MYVVEEILNKRYEEETHTFSYFVKWEGFPNTENTWEPEESLLRDVPEMVVDYNDRLECIYYKASYFDKLENSQDDNHNEKSLEKDNKASNSEAKNKAKRNGRRNGDYSVRNDLPELFKNEKIAKCTRIRKRQRSQVQTKQQKEQESNCTTTNNSNKNQVPGWTQKQKQLKSDVVKKILNKNNQKHSNSTTKGLIKQIQPIIQTLYQNKIRRNTQIKHEKTGTSSSSPTQQSKLNNQECQSTSKDKRKRKKLTFKLTVRKRNRKKQDTDETDLSHGSHHDDSMNLGNHQSQSLQDITKTEQPTQEDTNQGTKNPKKSKYLPKSLSQQIQLDQLKLLCAPIYDVYDSKIDKKLQRLIITVFKDQIQQENKKERKNMSLSARKQLTKSQLLQKVKFKIEKELNSEMTNSQQIKDNHDQQGTQQLIQQSDALTNSNQISEQESSNENHILQNLEFKTKNEDTSRLYTNKNLIYDNQINIADLTKKEPAISVLKQTHQNELFYQQSEFDRTINLVNGNQSPSDRFQLNLPALQYNNSNNLLLNNTAPPNGYFSAQLLPSMQTNQDLLNETNQWQQNNNALLAQTTQFSENIPTRMTYSDDYYNSILSNCSFSENSMYNSSSQPNINSNLYQRGQLANINQKISSPSFFAEMNALNILDDQNNSLQQQEEQSQQQKFYYTSNYEQQNNENIQKDNPNTGPHLAYKLSNDTTYAISSNQNHTHRPQQQNLEQQFKPVKIIEQRDLIKANNKVVTKYLVEWQELKKGRPPGAGKAQNFQYECKKEYLKKNHAQFYIDWLEKENKRLAAQRLCQSHPIM